jgi:NAD(P)-dependent dehydrogenase (short-subunit alcohol dehydrogenase family)
MPLLTGKVAVITGASSGNGRAIALAFAKEGADIVIADIREDPREGGLATQKLIELETSQKALFVSCDVCKLDDLETAMAAADSLGGIDIMVNNAGILKKQSVLEASEEDFDLMTQVNIKSVYFGTQMAAKRMLKKGKGTIINLSSIAGMRATGGYALYCTSKGAVRLMSHALADELGPLGIRVNALHPGIINTQMNIADDPIIGTETGEIYLDMIPLRRWGEPEDVAKAALYLASELSSYVTGSSLVVDGGYLRI